MSKQAERKNKIITFNQRDPNYISTFVTDAFMENTPDESTVRLTFYEEVGFRPNAQVSELSEDGRIIDDTTENIFLNPLPETEGVDTDISDKILVKRIDKATLVMSKESMLRLRDWLNERLK